MPFFTISKDRGQLVFTPFLASSSETSSCSFVCRLTGGNIVCDERSVLPDNNFGVFVDKGIGADAYRRLVDRASRAWGIAPPSSTRHLWRTLYLAQVCESVRIGSLKVAADYLRSDPDEAIWTVSDMGKESEDIGLAPGKKVGRSGIDAYMTVAASLSPVHFILAMNPSFLAPFYIQDGEGYGFPPPAFSDSDMADTLRKIGRPTALCISPVVYTAIRAWGFDESANELAGQAISKNSWRNKLPEDSYRYRYHRCGGSCPLSDKWPLGHYLIKKEDAKPISKQHESLRDLAWVLGARGLSPQTDYREGEKLDRLVELGDQLNVSLVRRADSILAHPGVTFDSLAALFERATGKKESSTESGILRLLLTEANRLGGVEPMRSPDVETIVIVLHSELLTPDERYKLVVERAKKHQIKHARGESKFVGRRPVILPSAIITNVLGSILVAKAGTILARHGANFRLTPPNPAGLGRLVNRILTEENAALKAGYEAWMRWAKQGVGDA